MERGQPKIWVNGTFDVMHIGHIKLLEYAYSFGDVYVGLDTDERIRQFKGENRPINTLKDRIEFMKSIKYVKEVYSFGSDDQLIWLIRDFCKPDIMVIGDDYMNKPIIGGEFIKTIIFFSKIEGKSSTGILNYDKNISNRK